MGCLFANTVAATSRRHLQNLSESNRWRTKIWLREPMLRQPVVSCRGRFTTLHRQKLVESLGFEALPTRHLLIIVDFEICMSRNLGPEKKVNPIRCGIWSWSQILGRLSWPLVSRFHRANHLLGSRHVRVLQTYLGSKLCILPMIIIQSIRRHFPILFKMANVS